jgi:hypothetical protein
MIKQNKTQIDVTQDKYLDWRVEHGLRMSEDNSPTWNFHEKLSNNGSQVVPCGRTDLIRTPNAYEYD